MTPETPAATAEPLVAVPPDSPQVALALAECGRVQRLVAEMLRDPMLFTQWRELHAACVAAEVCVCVARMCA